MADEFIFSGNSLPSYPRVQTTVHVTRVAEVALKPLAVATNSEEKMAVLGCGEDFLRFRAVARKHGGGGQVGTELQKWRLSVTLVT